MKTCPRCKLPAKWLRNGRKWVLLDPDGKEHYDTCSKERWRIIKEGGVRFEKEDCSGYEYQGKRHYDWIRGPTITGPDFPFKDDPIVKSENPWHALIPKRVAVS